jgi:hypothetical protein
VSCRLSKTPKIYREKILKKPAAFPKYCPIGCPPRPPEWNVREAEFGKTGQDRVDALHELAIESLEEELIGIYDLRGPGQEKYKGRAAIPRLIWRHAGGAPNGKHPHSTRSGRKWRCMQRRLEDVLAAGRAGEEERLRRALELTKKTMEEAAGACGFPKEMAALITSSWASLTDIGAGGQAVQEVTELCEHCELQASEIERLEANERTNEYRAWAKRATENGGGEAHNFTRVPKPWADVVTPGGRHPHGQQGLSTEPQRVVDAELEK